MHNCYCIINAHRNTHIVNYNLLLIRKFVVFKTYMNQINLLLYARVLIWIREGTMFVVMSIIRVACLVVEQIERRHNQKLLTP